MKSDRKIKTEKTPSKVKTVKGVRQMTPKTNGKHPLTSYEHIPIGIVECSLDGKYMDVNEEFCRITGYARSTLLRRGIKDLTHEDDYAVDTKLHEELVAGKIPFYRLEKQYVRKDDSSIWVELTRSLVRDSKGNPLYTIGVVLDISERKQVERVLHESVERLRLATGAAQMFMWEWDFQNQSYILEDSFEKVLGFSAGLLPKNQFETVWALSPKEDIQQMSEEFEKAVNGQRDLHALPYRVINPENGQMVWLEISAKIVYDHKGQPLRMFGVAQNITESKQKEKEINRLNTELQARLDEMNTLLEILPTGVWIGNEDCSVITGNLAAYQILGFAPNTNVSVTNPESDVPTGLKIFVDGKEVKPEDAPMQVVARSGKPWHNFEHELLFSDGTRKAVYGNVVPLFDQDGAVRKVIASYADFTERKRAEEALRESEERFRALVSQATAGITQSNMNGALTFVNPRFCEILGYAEEELLGKTIWELTYPEDLEENKRLFQRMLTQGESYQFEKRFIRKDGSTLWASVSVSTIRDLAGNPKGGVGVILDIEKRKKAEAALAEFAHQQAALYKLSDQLHTTASLEDVFNAALDAILSALQCDRASILLYDDQNVMRFVAWRGLSDDYRRATDGHSPWRPDAINPQPISMDDVRTADLDEHLREVIEAEGIGSLAFIPLVSNGRLIGKFMVYFNTPHVFDENDVDLSLTIAHQLTAGVDRKRAEEKLRGSEEHFRNLANAMPSIVWTAAPDGTITYANDQWYRFVGITPEENATGWPELVLHPDDYERCVRAWTHALETVPDEYLIEVRNRRYDGQYRWFQTRAIPVRDDSGKAKAWYGVTTDIHERIEAENRLALLAEISDMLRNVDDPNDLMYRISEAVGEHLHVKRALFNEIDLEHDREIVHRDYHKDLESVEGVHKVTDYSSITSAEVAAGRSVVNPDSKTDPRTAQDYERTYARTGERAYVVVPLMRDNHWVASFWVSDDAPRQWSSEEISLLETVAERTWAIIEKMRIAQELHVKEAELEAIITQTPFMLTRCTRDLRYRFVSRAYAEMIGCTPEEVAGKPIVEIMGEEGLRTISPYIEQVLAGNQVEYESEVSFEGGGTPFLHVVYTPDRDDEGNVIGWFASIVDISERRRAEEALRASEERYRFIVENTSDGIWSIELTEPMPISLPEEEQIDWYYEHAVIRQCNLGLARMYGYDSIEEVVGLPMQIVMPREDPANLELSRKFIRSGYRLVDSESREVDKDGRELVFLNNMIGIVEDGKLKGEWGTNRDITQRKRAEEALRQSEERFGRFMQYLPGLAWIKDMEGRYVYANSAAEEAFRTPREKLYGRTDPEIFPAEVAAQFRKNDELAFAEGKGLQVVEVLEQEDGVLHYSLVSKFPIPGPDGNPALIGGTAFDITERLRAQDALRESEERLSAVLRQATAGIVRKDAEGRLIFVNQAFCNMLGYTEAELLGKTNWEFMHPDDIEENKKHYNRLMMEGIPFKLERRFLREDGSVIWVDASVSPIIDAEGKPQSAVAVEVDITARKQAEEALQQLNLQLEDTVLRRTAKLRAVNQTLRDEIAERKRVEEALRQSEATARTSEEKLRTLFDLLPVGISFLSPEGEIVQMNSALSVILKLPKEQLLAQAYKSRKYIRADGTPMPPTEFASARALAEGITVYNLETGILLENGEVIWTSVSAAPVEVADFGAVVVTVDITDSKRAEQALLESYKRLRILSQRLVEVQEDERRALARELHDRVGQTLAALNINLIIVNSQLSSEVSQQIGTRLNDSMKLVAETIALVRDVMTDLRPSVLDDYGLEAAIESHLAQFTSRYNIKAKFEKPDPPLPRLGPSLEMTFLRITQEALMNIARHAQADQVNLSLRQEGDKVCLTIQDNGIGIASRQEANRPGSHGLNIMRERAEAFDGDMRVKSLPGRGTTIEVNIPFKHGSQTEAREEKRL